MREARKRLRANAQRQVESPGMLRILLATRKKNFSAVAAVQYLLTFCALLPTTSARLEITSLEIEQTTQDESRLCNPRRINICKASHPPACYLTRKGLC